MTEYATVIAVWFDAENEDEAEERITSFCDTLRATDAVTNVAAEPAEDQS